MPIPHQRKVVIEVPKDLVRSSQSESTDEKGNRELRNGLEDYMR